MSKAAKLAWYANRLRTMGPAEIAHRVRTLARTRAEKAGLFVAGKPPRPDVSRQGAAWVHTPRLGEEEVARYTARADSVLAGRLNVFALEDVELGNPPQWNRDPRTGTRAPLVFGKTLDYRDERLVGDIKYLWEPSRHLQFPWLAQAWALTRSHRYAQGLATQLESWLEQCPYLMGAHWTSSLELGIRLINWSIAWQLLGGATSQTFEGDRGRRLKERWLDSVYQHVHFIKGHYSAHSSANNHLIGEAAGVYVACKTWPFWPEFETWGARAKTILEEQALLQNAPDGVNREQAISYQQFVLDFLLVSLLSGRASGDGFSPGYLARMDSMLEFVAAIMDMGGNVPMIGDADDGYAVALSAEADFCPFRSLLATGSALFSRPTFLDKAGNLDHKTRWLLGDEAAQTAPHNHKESPLPRAFPEGGYYILGSGLDTDEEIRLIMDCGPLGYLSIAAHGHADALAVALSVSGQEILIDPGTYAYHTKAEWRNYFRGTSAHNTVRIDGLDQSEIGGNFMWLRKATAVCTEYSPEKQTVAGSHDGYALLPDPVTHQRRVRFDSDSETFTITDVLDCKERHVVERFLHFAEGCFVEADGNVVLAKCGETVVQFEFTGAPQNIVLHRGEENPPLGWVSRRFDVKAPATTLVCTDEIDGRSELEILIRIMNHKPGRLS